MSTLIPSSPFSIYPNQIHQDESQIGELNRIYRHPTRSLLAIDAHSSKTKRQWLTFTPKSGKLDEKTKGGTVRGTTHNKSEATLPTTALNGAWVVADVPVRLHVDPKYRQTLLKQIAYFTGRRGALRDFDVRLQGKDGKALNCFITSKARRNVKGTIVAYDWVVRDVTHVEMTEQRLLEYQQQLRRLASKLATAEEHERRKLAADLHHRVGQALSITQMKVESLIADNGKTDIGSSLDNVRSLIKQMNVDIHSLSFELNPPMLYDLGLGPAVEWFCDGIHAEHGLLVAIEDDTLDGQPDDLADELRGPVFRIIRELLMNVVKHAQTTNARIKIQRSGGNLQVEVIDDGVGFKIPIVHSKSGTAEFGLFSIRESAMSFEGTFEIKSAAGEGTTAKLTAPMNLSRNKMSFSTAPDKPHHEANKKSSIPVESLPPVFF